MIDMIGKIVEVITAETVYIGKLVEVNDEEVFLESDTGWLVIPVDRIADIREKNKDEL
jgi:ribosome maturation factor RimP